MRSLEVAMPVSGWDNTLPVKISSLKSLLLHANVPRHRHDRRFHRAGFHRRHADRRRADDDQGHVFSGSTPKALNDALVANAPVPLSEATATFLPFKSWPDCTCGLPIR